MTVRAMIQRFGKRVSTQRPTTANDNGGFPAETYATNLTNVRAFIQPSGGFQTVIHDGERHRRTARIFMLPGTDIAAQDRIINGSDTWEVESVSTPGEFPSSSHMAHIRIEAEERE
jgi:head-tail adaptor